MRACGKAALATRLADGGAPYASLVTVALDHDASPILLLSALSDHTRNLQAEPRLALLFDGTGAFENPQEGPRVTVTGRIVRSAEARHRARFLARHPAAVRYVDFPDFAVYSVSVERVHWVGGFARAVWLTDLAVDSAAAARLVAAEAEILSHMNRDHAAALDLYATRLLGAAGGGWRMVAIDIDGCDLARDGEVRRLAFDAPAEDAGAVRRMLLELAARARA